MEEKKTDIYNRKGFFLLWLGAAIIFSTSTFKLLIQHEHIIWAMLSFIITAYAYISIFSFLFVFFHGKASPNLGNILIDSFNINTNKEPIVNKQYDRYMWAELKRVVEKTKPYYVMDYALILDGLNKKYSVDTGSKNMVDIMFCLSLTKNLNKLAKKHDKINALNKNQDS